MNEEARKVRFYLRSGKSVPPRKVYCYAIESVSRYEPQGNSTKLRKRSTHTVWRAAAPNERASFNSMKECRAWIARITGGIMLRPRVGLLITSEKPKFKIFLATCRTPNC